MRVYLVTQLVVLKIKFFAFQFCRLYLQLGLFFHRLLPVIEEMRGIKAEVEQKNDNKIKHHQNCPKGRGQDNWDIVFKNRETKYRPGSKNQQSDQDLYKHP